MTLSELVKWLRKTPRPVCVVADDQRIVVPPRGAVEAADTIWALQPERIVALNKDGATVRAFTFDRDDEDAKEAKPAPKEIPPEILQIQTFARLISEAYAQGANATKEAYTSIFEENTKLVKLLADRLGAIEALWQRSLTNTADLVTELAEARAQPVLQEGGGSFVEQVIPALMSGMAQAHQQQQAAGSAPARPQPRTNGKVPHK